MKVWYMVATNGVYPLEKSLDTAKQISTHRLGTRCRAPYTAKKVEIEVTDKEKQEKLTQDARPESSESSPNRRPSSKQRQVDCVQAPNLRIQSSGTPRKM